MRKKLTLMFILILALTLAFTLAACNDNNTNPDPSNPGGDNEYEGTEFTVRFVTGTDMTIPSQRVKYGEKAEKPKTDPSKYGYDFKGWSTSKQTADNFFDFGKDTIKKNITLYAQFTAKTYEHTLVLVDPTIAGAAEIEEMLKPLDADTKHYSTYDSDDDRFPVPELTAETADGAYVFKYWYYYDEDGKIVRFTEYADPESKTVKAKDTFTSTAGKTLYGMYERILPEITVDFYTDRDAKTPYKSVTVKQGYPISATEMPAAPSKDGYAFEYWYILSHGADGAEILTEWIFDDPDNNDDKPTIADKDPVEPKGAVISVYAKWNVNVKITDTDSYNKFADQLKEAYNALVTAQESKNEDKIAEAQKRIDELQHAKISFGNVITLDVDRTLYSDFAFKGVLDGGIYTDGKLNKNSSVTLNITAETNAALIGINEGVIKNLDIKANIKITGTAGTAYAAAVTVNNMGTINNVRVTSLSLTVTDKGISVIFGGISAALNEGGEIASCSVTGGSAITVTAKDITAGGIVGSMTKGKITGCTSDISFAFGSDGSDSVLAGGIAGKALGGGEIRECKSTINVSAGGGSYRIGGIAGWISTASVKQNTTDLTVSGSVSNAKIGGIAGSHSGVVEDCMANITIDLTSDTAVYIGGIAGESTGVGNSNSGKTSRSYATGNIKVTDAAGDLQIGGLAGYIRSGSLTSCFSDVTVTVTAKEGAKFYIGQSVGRQGSGENAISKTFHAEGNAVTVNGAPYENLTEAGEAVAKAKFSDADWVNNDLGFVLPDEDVKNPVWMMPEGGGYPVLIWTTK